MPREPEEKPLDLSLSPGEAWELSAMLEKAWSLMGEWVERDDDRRRALSKLDEALSALIEEAGFTKSPPSAGGLDGEREDAR